MINEQIEQITTDSRFQRLKYLQEKKNIFTIVGQTHTEHWHSSFISWLLDPHSSMCLGHYALARLLNIYLSKAKDSDFTLKELYGFDLNQVHFQTEKTFILQGTKKRSIDVYGESEELIIVIENKVKAAENFNGSEVGQTQDYYDYIERRKKEGQRSFYFFITPSPKQNAFHKAYMQITYQEMYDCIIAKCMEHPQISVDSRYVLEQYANNLRETVNNSPMALVNIGMCQELYIDYKSVFDDIFSAVEQTAGLADDNGIFCVFYHRYQSVLDEIFLSVDNYGRTPRSLQERITVTFDDLYKSGRLRDGAPLTMEYAGVQYYAVAEVVDGKCYMKVLDENKKPFVDKEGAKIGYYKTSSQAGMDLINRKRRLNGSEEMVRSLNGPAYWKLEDGRSLKELMTFL